MPELKELVEAYKPSIIWSDGVAGLSSWNERWGTGIPCHHGDLYTCTDHYNPGVLQPHK